MLGEELNATDITKGGLLGDRAYGIMDRADGKIATAKNPRKWPRLFEFRAALAEMPAPGITTPVRITLPDGTVLNSSQPDVDQMLSSALNRDVSLAKASANGSGTAEEYWPDIELLEHQDTVTEFDLPPGTFFDCASAHLLTTATLDRLRELYPQGRFEIRRFRPNIVVETATDGKDFVENNWVGKTVAIGDTVRLSITGPCPRCVMTTLAQSDLPRDPGILRTAAQHNRANVGVYASVLQGGRIRRGDSVRLEQSDA
jgi:uncharacterized protein YcbX